MAILTAVSEAGEEVLYDIPDNELSKYKLNTAQLTDEARSRLFPGKGKLTKDDAQGVMATAPGAGSDVEGYAAICKYWIIADGVYYYWYDYC